MHQLVNYLVYKKKPQDEKTLLSQFRHIVFRNSMHLKSLKFIEKLMGCLFVMEFYSIKSREEVCPL